jgi:hypothetical protein
MPLQKTRLFSFVLFPVFLPLNLFFFTKSLVFWCYVGNSGASRATLTFQRNQTGFLHVLQMAVSVTNAHSGRKFDGVLPPLVTPCHAIQSR